MNSHRGQSEYTVNDISLLLIYRISSLIGLSMVLYCISFQSFILRLFYIVPVYVHLGTVICPYSS